MQGIRLLTAFGEEVAGEKRAARGISSNGRMQERTTLHLLLDYRNNDRVFRDLVDFPARVNREITFIHFAPIGRMRVI